MQPRQDYALRMLRSMLEQEENRLALRPIVLMLVKILLNEDEFEVWRDSVEELPTREEAIAKRMVDNWTLTWDEAEQQLEDEFYRTNKPSHRNQIPRSGPGYCVNTMPGLHRPLPPDDECAGGDAHEAHANALVERAQKAWHEEKPPISAKEILTALAQGKFKEFDEEDYQLWPGTEGRGFSWDPEETDIFVLCDLKSDNTLIFNTISTTPDREQNWSMSVNVTNPLERM